MKSPRSVRSSRSPRPRSAGMPAEVRVPARWHWHYRTLLALREHLRETRGDRLREPAEAMEAPSAHGVDFLGDRYDRDLRDALPEHPDQALAEVDRALARIEQGTFGRCERTGRRIPASRLRALPWCRE